VRSFFWHVRTLFLLWLFFGLVGWMVARQTGLPTGGVLVVGVATIVVWRRLARGHRRTEALRRFHGRNWTWEEKRVYFDALRQGYGEDAAVELEQERRGR
jgi:hypothetical protein